MAQISENTPLSIVNPEIFGKFDDDEKRMICDYNTIDLILIENASEIFRILIQQPLIFENILNGIIKETKRKGIKVLESETFPFYMNKSSKLQHYKFDPMCSFKKSMKEEYDYLIDEYRKNLPSREDILITILAVDLGEFGGHYAAFVARKSEPTLIFDSMQENKKWILYSLFYSTREKFI